MNASCKVTIYCTAFNHEKYIREALDSFLAQKTDFPFEVLINDDASTDTTADIIREYAEKHPDIIRPFYQEENLYSVHRPLRGRRLLERPGKAAAAGELAGYPSGLLCLCPQQHRLL